MYLEKSRGCGLRIGVAFVALVLPMLPAHRTLSHLQEERRTPLENLCNSSSSPSLAS
jgi:hypothetical protein